MVNRHPNPRPLASGAALALALLAAGCTTTMEHSGNPPEGPRRDFPADAAGERPRGSAIAEGEVLGVRSTRIYHVPGCRHLEAVPRTEQVTFVSPYDAVNDVGRYRPCRDCNPGP